MDGFLLTLGGLGLFAARDAKGLAWNSGPGLRALYAVVFLAVGAALGSVAEQVSGDEAQAMLRNACLWGPSLGIHALLWIAFQRAKQARRGARWPTGLFVLPAPVSLYSLGGGVWVTLQRTNLTGIAAGALVAGLFVASVLVAAWLGNSPPRLATNGRAALEWGAAANLAAFLLIPLQQESRASGLLAPPVNWSRTAVAWFIVLALVGASFGFNRIRRAS